VPVVLLGGGQETDDTTEALPTWVTENSEPDLSDPIGTRDEPGEPDGLRVKVN
jgi:hypothetical protein